MAAFRQGLNEAGYVEGQNLAIEYRWAEGSYDRLPALAADLVDRKVDLIATSGGPSPAQAAKSATATIPITFVVGTDPVELGLVASLARPGGNLTGFSLLVRELAPKRLELLSELVLQAVRDAQEAARDRGKQLEILKAESDSEVDAAFTSLLRQQAGALIVAGDSFFFSRREWLAALALRHAVPAIFTSREAVLAGGLISYGTNYKNASRGAGVYTGKILKGEKPADLPVQQPTKFELVINLKTAQALGLTVPQALLARADEVIE